MFPECSFRLTGHEEHIESGLGFVGAKLHTHTERVGSRGVALNNIIKTISVRLEQSNLCHLQLRGYLHVASRKA